MADMGDGGGGHEKGGKKRAKKGSTRVDMTPLVDLAFLLLTFFVLTSTFSVPKIMKLNYPAKPKIGDPPGQKINNAITFLISKDKDDVERIFYYKDEFFNANNESKEGKPHTKLTETNFGTDDKSVRAILSKANNFILAEKSILLKKKSEEKITQAQYDAQMDKLLHNKKHALTVLIKTDDKAVCKGFIDLIDELRIHEISSLAPVDMLMSENELLQKAILTPKNN